ncbi:MAG: hypothetical protein Q7R47_03215, partial [Candidatus Diapherotrites archaeon]|nr:hypothetical protein [Candidatus Diapherotrites archaeon]
KGGNDVPLTVPIQWQLVNDATSKDPSCTVLTDSAVTINGINYRLLMVDPTNDKTEEFRGVITAPKELAVISSEGALVDNRKQDLKGLAFYGAYGDAFNASASRFDTQVDIANIEGGKICTTTTQKDAVVDTQITRISDAACRTCGAIGKECCDNNVCPTSGICVGKGICVDEKEAAACGGVGQKCCSGFTCPTSGACYSIPGSTPVCIECGGTNRICCDKDTCSANNKCQTKDYLGRPDSVCLACGGLDQQCCEGNTCTVGSCNAGDTCTLSCGNAGESACTDRDCAPGSTRTTSPLSQSGYKILDQCVSCGGVGDPPCTDGTNFFCDAGLGIAHHKGLWREMDGTYPSFCDMRGWGLREDCQSLWNLPFITC